MSLHICTVMPESLFIVNTQSMDVDEDSDKNLELKSPLHLSRLLHIYGQHPMPLGGVRGLNLCY